MTLTNTPYKDQGMNQLLKCAQGILSRPINACLRNRMDAFDCIPFVPLFVLMVVNI